MVIFQITSQISGFGKEPTVVTEFFEDDSSLAAAAAAKETYGDKFVQIISMEEMEEDECNCGGACNCDCDCHEYACCG